MATDARCSIIIPVLNDAQALLPLLSSLQPLRKLGHEVLVVDGGSDDDSEGIANSLADKFLCCSRGRARQMNFGAALAEGDVFWFLHADSEIDAMQCLKPIISLLSTDKVWGFFDIRLSGKDRRLRLVEKMMNLRSRLTGIATGDQGIFIKRDVFFRLEGFANVPLMEDIEMSRSLRAISRPVSTACSITTSSRRWERQGVFRTIVLMWSLRLAYYFGFSADRLSRYYRACSSPMQR